MEKGAKRETPERGDLDNFLEQQRNHTQELLGAEDKETAASRERRKGVEMQLRELAQNQDLLDFLKAHGEAIATLVRDDNGKRLLSLDCRGGIILHYPYQTERYVLAKDSHYNSYFDRHQAGPDDKEFTLAGGKVFLRTTHPWGPLLEIDPKTATPLFASARFPASSWKSISAKSIERTIMRSVEDIAAERQPKEDAWQGGYSPSS